MTRKTYRIGGLCLRLECGEPILDADYYPLFRADDDAAPDVTVRVLRQPLPAPEGVTVLCTNRRRRVLSGGRTYDYTFFPDAARLEHVPYACAVREGANVTLSVDYGAPFWDTMLFGALGLPDLLLENAAVIVHAAFIGVGAGGLLFAGPKRQGKSTQARLWQTGRNALVINGDRAVVRETEQGFSAHGVPFCGSSRQCLNQTRPIRAIVFPEKGDHNDVAPLSAMDAFKRLIGCVSYTQADPAARDMALTLTERIASGCRCLLLTCRPEEGAVEALARELDGSI